MAMAETRRKFDEDFKRGAVQLVFETGKPIAQVARDLGVNEGTESPGGSRDFRAWEGWSHAGKFNEAVPAGAEAAGGADDRG
jgi:transposase